MILDSIFQGDFSVELFPTPCQSEYQKLNRSIETLSMQIKDLLGREKGEMLDELLNQVYASQYMEAQSCFKIGFAAGVDLQRDIEAELNGMKKPQVSSEV